MAGLLTTFASTTFARFYCSPENEERLLRRRERNVVHVTKYRSMKKVLMHKLCQEIQTLESANYNLKIEVENLERKVQRLNDILNEIS